MEIEWWRTPKELEMKSNYFIATLPEGHDTKT